MARVIMVVGGSRSGKSAYAEQMAVSLSHDEKQEVTYLATATVWDDEFAERVKKHKERRPANWQTIEEACDIDLVLLNEPEKEEIFLIDGIGTWVANLMYRDNWPDFSWNPAKEKILMDKVNQLITSFPAQAGSIILVADETGMGIVPENEQARIFRDMNGWTNQRLAQAASQVYLLSCGIPLQLK